MPASSTRTINILSAVSTSAWPRWRSLRLCMAFTITAILHGAGVDVAGGACVGRVVAAGEAIGVALLS